MSDVLEKLRDDAQYYGAFGKQYLSNSDIGTLLSNPSDFGVSRADNQAFAQGRLFHQLILEPQKAEDWKFVDVSSRNTKAYKEFVAENNLEFALLEKENLHIRNLVDVMMGNMDFYDDIRHEGNEYEVPAVGEIEGLMWKGKADIVHPEMRPTEEFVKGGRDKVKRAVEVYNKFFSKDATDDISFYYVEEYL